MCKSSVSSLDRISFQLCHVPAMEILSGVPAMEEVDDDVDLSFVILSDAFFESKLLSTVFGACFFSALVGGCCEERILTTFLQ